MTWSALEEPVQNSSHQSVFCVFMSSHAFTLHSSSPFSPWRQNISDMSMHNSLFQHLCLMVDDYRSSATNKLDNPQILPSLL